MLPAGLSARPEEAVLLETAEFEPRAAYRPELAVIETPTRPDDVHVVTGGVAVAEPVRVRMFTRQRTIRWIEIVDERDKGRLVTAIEILSPSNKVSGEDRRRYHRKVRRYFQAGVSLVEIDLLRGNRRKMWFTWDQLRPEQRTDYLIVVRRRRSPVINAYPISLRDPLPKIGVPLRNGDTDAPIDLQAALSQVFEDGPFDSIDYTRPCEPPLDASEAGWVAQLVAARSKT